MSTPSREQIEKWDALAEEHAERTARTSEEWSMAWRMEFARLVRAAALEEAKEACLEIMPEHNHLIGPYQCAKAIAALAAKEPQP